MPKPKTVTTREPAPEWTAHTPRLIYTLHLENSLADSDPGVDGSQTVELTREEYIALKLHLAKMRGYAVEGEA